MTADRERCSSISLRLDEPMWGTASTVRNWLLVEQPGPWGRNAIDDSRLPEEVKRRLARYVRELALRVVLIRRVGRSEGDGSECFLAHTGPDEPWIERARLADVRELLDVPIEPLAGGERAGLGASAEALYVVCTHGRRDPCCAEKGRPLAAALAEELGAPVWESSHIGGDRFAANLVCFPHGVYFGRLSPEDGPRVARSYAAGRIELEWYRGRSCYGFATQAAEHFLRRDRGIDGVEALRLAGVEVVAGRETRAAFETADGERIDVTVETVRAEPPRPLTCHADAAGAPPAYRLVGIDDAAS